MNFRSHSEKGSYAKIGLTVLEICLLEIIVVFFCHQKALKAGLATFDHGSWATVICSLLFNYGKMTLMSHVERTSEYCKGNGKK